jgi:hypothetical protein
MNNVIDLRNEMIKTYGELRGGKIDLKQAKEYANICGKVLASAKLQLDYAQFTKSSANIEFLETPVRK